MEKEALKKLIRQKKSTREIANELGGSQGNVRYYLKKYGLKTEPAYFKASYECKTCDEKKAKKFVLIGNGKRSKTKCKKCHSKYTIERFREYKKQAVEYLGGKCISCGYNRCVGSLHCHHRNPKKKDPDWRRMRNWKFERIKKELDKCNLLCGNCHGEEHWLKNE